MFSPFCILYAFTDRYKIRSFALPVKCRYVRLIQREIIIIQVFPPSPSDAVPESISDVVGGKGDKADLVHLLLLQCVHAVNHHSLADALPAPVLPDAHMVQTAPSAVMAAEDAAHNNALTLVVGFRLRKRSTPSRESSMLRMPKPRMVFHRA